MTRRWSGGLLVLATHNPGKLREIADLMRPFDVETRSAGDFGLPEPEETGTTFAANALLKARAAAEGAGHPALADDSGLVVEALGGDPGIYSARWAGPEKDFGLAMRKVEDGLAGRGNRRAHFICVLALVWPDGTEAVYEGRIDGELVWPPRGGLGFGYDPMFLADGYDQTFGEMDQAKKHGISHRARAFGQLVDQVFAEAS